MLSPNKPRPDAIPEIDDQIEPLTPQGFDEASFPTPSRVFTAVIVNERMVNLRVARQQIERPAANKEGNPGIREATAERANHRRREDSIADEAETEDQNLFAHRVNILHANFSLSPHSGERERRFLLLLQHKMLTEKWEAIHGTPQF
jgi:hypothetical protein